MCVQEIKALPEQLEDNLKNPLKYHAIWNPAQKPGYSGTAIFSKKEPLSVVILPRKNGHQNYAAVNCCCSYPIGV